MLWLALLLTQAEPADPGLLGRLKDKVRFSAFADVSLGTEFGASADKHDAALFEAFGTDDFPLNSYGDGFGVVGTDFVVTADVADNVVFQGEVNLQVERGTSNEIALDFERFYIDYRHNELFNVQAGFFFTPIGYHNRFLYSRAWLMHSVLIPDLFEEELNFVPTHSTGVNVHGRFQLFGQTFKYVVGLANGRGIEPTENIFARDRLGKEQTLLLEWEVPGFSDFLVGVSGWTDVIRTRKVDGYGTTVVIDGAEKVRLREFGFNPYVTYYGETFNLLAEFVVSTQRDEIGNLDRSSYLMHGFTAELSINLVENTLHPYIRYDYTNLPSDQQGPYFGLRRDDDTLTRFFIPEAHAVMIGANYDLNANMRFKLEYAAHFDGARDANAVVAQLAYGF
ncbi:MAG TPA: hypothetical protein VF950_14145 [Planctomycetota bacterium]